MNSKTIILERGKVVVHCTKCHTNFGVYPECVPDTCPFCKAPIKAIPVIDPDSV